jgi:regulator of RNase E activity RraA
MNQAKSAKIRPLDDASVRVGRARTGLYMDVYHVEPGDNPYLLEMRLIDDLKPDEIAVFACGQSGRIAPWGELLSTASRARGAAGCVMDGLVRDIRAIRKMGFPVFHGGIGPLDSKGRGKIMAIDVPVECAGVRVAPGDLIFGDADGVVVIPQAIEDKVIAAALEKIEGEDRTREALERGETLASVFARYGIL